MLNLSGDVNNKVDLNVHYVYLIGGMKYTNQSQNTHFAMSFHYKNPHHTMSFHCQTPTLP